MGPLRLPLSCGKSYYFYRISCMNPLFSLTRTYGGKMWREMVALTLVHVWFSLKVRFLAASMLPVVHCASTRHMLGVRCFQNGQFGRISSTLYFTVFQSLNFRQPGSSKCSFVLLLKGQSCDRYIWALFWRHLSPWFALCLENGQTVTPQTVTWNSRGQARVAQAVLPPSVVFHAETLVTSSLCPQITLVLTPTFGVFRPCVAKTCAERPV